MSAPYPERPPCPQTWLHAPPLCPHRLFFLALPLGWWDPSSQPGIESGPSAVRARSPNRRTHGGIPSHRLLFSTFLFTKSMLYQTTFLKCKSEISPPRAAVLESLPFKLQVHALLQGGPADRSTCSLPPPRSSSDAKLLSSNTPSSLPLLKPFPLLRPLPQTLFLLCWHDAIFLSPKPSSGTSPVVQRLRLLTSTAGAMGSSPGQGTKTPHTTWCSQSKHICHILTILIVVTPMLVLCLTTCLIHRPLSPFACVLDTHWDLSSVKASSSAVFFTATHGTE